MLSLMSEARTREMGKPRPVSGLPGNTSTYELPFFVLFCFNTPPGDLFSLLLGREEGGWGAREGRRDTDERETLIGCLLILLPNWGLN